jgi:hypothetical protein
MKKAVILLGMCMLLLTACGQSSNPPANANHGEGIRYDPKSPDKTYEKSPNMLPNQQKDKGDVHAN